MLLGVTVKFWVLLPVGTVQVLSNVVATLDKVLPLPKKLAAVMLPVTLTVVPVWVVAEMFPPVILPVELITPPVSTLPPVTLAALVIVEVAEILHGDKYDIYNQETKELVQSLLEDGTIRQQRGDIWLLPLYRRSGGELVRMNDPISLEGKAI